jgi:hypothetical protein
MAEWRTFTQSRIKGAKPGDLAKNPTKSSCLSTCKAGKLGIAHSADAAYGSEADIQLNQHCRCAKLP